MKNRWLVIGGWWSVVGGWWLVIGGRWLVAGGRWSVVGDRWLVVGGWWLVVGSTEDWGEMLSNWCGTRSRQVVDSKRKSTTKPNQCVETHPPTTSHRSPATGHQPPATSHQPPTTDHQPPTTLANAGWLTGSRLAGDCLGLLLFVVFSRNFGPQGIGLYAYGFAIAGLMYVIANLGLEDYGVRELSRLSDSEARQLFSRLFSAQLAVTALLAGALVLFLAITSPEAETARIILLLSAYQLLFAFSKTLFLPALARQKMARAAIAEFVCRGGGIIAAVVLVLAAGTSLSAALVPLALSGLLLLVAAFQSSRAESFFPAPVAELRPLWTVVQRAWPFAASFLVFQLYARADLLMLYFFKGESSAGIYAAALKFVEVGIMPAVFLGFASYPVLSRLFQHDRPAFLDSADRLLRILLVLGGLLAWGLIFVVPSLVVPLLDMSFAPSIPVIRLLAAAGFLLTVEAAAVRILLSADNQVRRVKQQTAAVILNIVLNLAFIPAYGIMGAVAASILSLLALETAYLLSLYKILATSRFAKSLQAFGFAIGAGVAAGVLTANLSGTEWMAATTSILAFGAVLLAGGFLEVKHFRRKVAGGW